MLFSSLNFLVAFMPLFFLCYLSINNLTWRNTVLFVFSLVFYAWGEPLFVFLMLFSLAVNYIFGLLIANSMPNKKLAKCYLIIVTVIDLGLLGIFKYTGFIAESITSITGLTIPVPQITLPIGISFYTFQILSYVIDVYRGETEVQKNFVYLGTYLAAFPQLIAGPIVRYVDVARELTSRTITVDDMTDGIRRFIVGLGKKVLIANQAAMVADSLFASQTAELGVIGSWVAALAYTIQIYYDFSGYSDMAIGMGKMMGFRYLENFNYPYSAVSVTDFWRKWHMSLSTFFRDYVYIPLGGNRVSKPRWIFNTMVVWMLTGLWHGASWNFVVWGLYYGILLLAEKLLFPQFQKKLPSLSHYMTLFITVIGWVVFRAETLTGAVAMYGSMFGSCGFAPEGIFTLLQRSGVGGSFVLAMIAGVYFSVQHRKNTKLSSKSAAVITDVLLLIVLLVCLLCLAAQSYNPFIYFRF